MSKYLSIVSADRFSIEAMHHNEVKLLKELVGKIPQSGIRYVEGSDAVVLVSSNMHDILQIVDNGCWAHSRTPMRVRNGTTVYVVPNDSVIAKYGSLAIGVKFVANAEASRSPEVANDLDWASEGNLAA